MLVDDRIRRVARTRRGEPAEAVYYSGGGINVQLNFFDLSPVDASWMLAHEDGHVIQYEIGMLMREIGTSQRPNRRRLRRMFGADEGSSELDAVQNDANAYACAVTLDWGQWTRYCTP